MHNFSEFELNSNYKKIRESGYDIKVTTHTKNRGVLYLMRGYKVVKTTEIRTNGRGTAAILKALPTAIQFTNIDKGLVQLACFVQEQEEQIQSINHCSNPFVHSYNAAILEHADDALLSIGRLPAETSFPVLFTVFTSDIATRIKNHEGK